MVPIHQLLLIERSTWPRRSAGISSSIAEFIGRVLATDAVGSQEAEDGE